MSNVVNAVFGATKKTKTDPIFQYDYGNKLQFVGVELPSSYEVHFANYNYGESGVMIGDSTGVEIPYEYTKNYGRVFAWVFIHENEDVGWTKYLAEIPVVQRAKPSYDPVDPYEQSIVEQLVSTVEGLQDDVTGVQEDVETLQQKKADVIVSSASGSVAAFADGADDMPVESLKCYIEPVQSGSGTPSPSNVRAISGWTGVNVTAEGKNLLKMRTTKATAYGITIEPDGNGYVNISGTSGSNSYTHDLVDMPNAELSALFAKGGTFTLSLNKGTYNGTTLNVSVTYKETETGSTKYVMPNTPATVPAGSIFLRAPLWVPANTTPQQLTGFALQLERNDAVTEFEPYTARTLSVTFPTSAGTVYGGYVDVVKGELVVTDGYISSYSGQSLPSTWISDRDAYTAGTSPTTGAQVVYKLATPTTYTITPQQLNTLLGNNSIYCDTGNTEISYPADTKLYIDGKIAELQALVLEN